MKNIEFTPQQKDDLTHKVKSYFRDELDQEIGAFDAEFLIDFFAREIGPNFYNRGLEDALITLQEKMDEASYVIQELEKPEGY